MKAGRWTIDFGAWRDADWIAARRPLALAAVLLVANLAVLTMWTRPRWVALTSVDAAARQGQSAQETLDPALRRARAEYAHVAAAERDLAELRARIGAQSGTVADVVSTLRAAIDASGLEADRILYQGQDVEELALSQVQIDLPIRGTYRNVRELLAALLTGPMFLVVERIAVTTPANASESDLQMQLGMSVFVDPEYRGPVASQGSPAGGSVEDSAEDESLASIGGSPVEVARQLRARLDALPPSRLSAVDLGLDLHRLDELETSPAAYSRNLFDFGPSVLAARRQAERQRDRDRRRRDETPPEPVMPYTLLGIVRAEGRLWATVDDGDAVHVVETGDLLPRGFRVAAIGLATIELEAGGHRVELSLRREDQNPRDVPASGGPGGIRE